MDTELIREIKWVMKNYGSDAGELQEPGSKLQAQAERIAAFVMQRQQASELLAEHNLDLVRVASVI